ncbi:MAG: amylo-alpha-1,6-glucosidase [Chloroflexota bacterium]
MLTGSVALKEDQLQFISNPAGDVCANGDGLGLYLHDTRFLSRLELVINGWKPIPISSTGRKHYIATFQLINPAFKLAGKTVPTQTISIRRSRFVSKDALYERIGLLNCNSFPVELDVTLLVDADFRDMFAVREFAIQPDTVIGRDIIDGGIRFQYQGRDNVGRASHVSFDRPPDAADAAGARFSLRLLPQQRETIVLRVQPVVGRGEPPAIPLFDRALDDLAESYRAWDEDCTAISTGNRLFDQEILRAGRYDLRALIESTSGGPVPDAGIPWYAVPFGRDAIITALQTLIYNPSIAEATLRFLAEHQGAGIDRYSEEEPGKIMHELRRGELARLGEVPHTPYFGTVDATPLFLVLLAEADAWLDSPKLVNDLWPSALRALDWIDRYGDVDGDGYIEYEAHEHGGVTNQGWKDSANSCQYEDGSNAQPPIALVEAQGYVYQAKTGMAALARERGEMALATRLETEAADLKERFNRDFWMPDLGFYAQALDGDKRQVRSITSNAGHCLLSGIYEKDKANGVVERLLMSDMFSGWGIRTLSAASPHYNPMSYHNGSVWPHDSALIALGMRRAGFDEPADRIVTGLIEAGLRFPDGRLPELFCGFERDRRFNSSPAAYVVSCSPQAWAAGAVFMLLETVLDARPNSRLGTVEINPRLPELLPAISLEHMRLGDKRVRVSCPTS